MIFVAGEKAVVGYDRAGRGDGHGGFDAVDSRNKKTPDPGKPRDGFVGFGRQVLWRIGQSFSNYYN